MEEPIAQMDNESIKSLMLPYLKKIYPTFTLAQVENTYVFKTFSAATVCDLNFSSKVPDCKTEIKGLYLANMNHIYPDERSTNNAIRVAAAACKKMGYNDLEVPANTSLSAKIGF
jgi:predicted Zn-ribbon and HTH transcriptional regulator